MAGWDWHRTFQEFEWSVRTNMQWRFDNEARIAEWLGSPGTKKSDRNLFITSKHITRNGADKDIYYRKKYLKI